MTGLKTLRQLRNEPIWKMLVVAFGTAFILALLIGWISWQIPVKLREERVREESLFALYERSGKWW